MEAAGCAATARGEERVRRSYDTGFVIFVYAHISINYYTRIIILRSSGRPHAENPCTATLLVVVVSRKNLADPFFFFLVVIVAVFPSFHTAVSCDRARRKKIYYYYATRNIHVVFITRATLPRRPATTAYASDVVFFKGIFRYLFLNTRPVNTPASDVRERSQQSCKRILNVTPVRSQKKTSRRFRITALRTRDFVHRFFTRRFPK